MVSISVAGKPVAKGRPRASARIVYKAGRPLALVHIHTPDTTAAQEREIARAAREAWGTREPLSGPVRLTVMSIFEPAASWSKKLRTAALEGRVPHMSKPDWDNLGKVTDALNGIIWTDDSHVVDARSVKRYGSPARVEITVEDASTPDMVLVPSKAGEQASERPAVRRPVDAPGVKKRSKAAPRASEELAIGKRIR